MCWCVLRCIGISPPFPISPSGHITLLVTQCPNGLLRRRRSVSRGILTAGNSLLCVCCAGPSMFLGVVRPSADIACNVRISTKAHTSCDDRTAAAAAAAAFANVVAKNASYTCSTYNQLQIGKKRQRQQIDSDFFHSAFSTCLGQLLANWHSPFRVLRMTFLDTHEPSSRKFSFFLKGGIGIG